MNIEIENLKETLIKFGEALCDFVRKIFKNFWDFIKDYLPQIRMEYFKKQVAMRNTRSSWYVKQDTRRKHQVVDNKPKLLVRKVIR
ncbi:hypothetical protein JMM81_12425 [Bacillus sp. V3B]|uniref:hypothetical protein n=1 Tax=Bacillus sp. V3B TaxID=2804915 RepID=UPI00210CCF79|nr:hypothetical protein [Bacillus sp. V3B]MCQ6275761.1 hypothetical protein [Bacillus sp. V3B]